MAVGIDRQVRMGAVHQVSRHARLLRRQPAPPHPSRQVEGPDRRATGLADEASEGLRKGRLRRAHPEGQARRREAAEGGRQGP